MTMPLHDRRNKSDDDRLKRTLSPNSAFQHIDQPAHVVAGDMESIQKALVQFVLELRRPLSNARRDRGLGPPIDERPDKGGGPDDAHGTGGQDQEIATMRNIRQNLFFALVYNATGVPIAAGVLFPFFGILISPIFAAAAMSLSSVSVISNALRLRSVKL